MKRIVNWFDEWLKEILIVVVIAIVFGTSLLLLYVLSTAP
jgi:hypothetical protein